MSEARRLSWIALRKTETYILQGHTPVAVPMQQWASWLEADVRHRRIAATSVGGSWVSTVFLGLDHNFGEGPPLLFETMVFEGPLDQRMQRYSTWEEAERGHYEMVLQVQASQRCLPHA